MVARGMRADAPRRLRIAQPENGVAGAAGLERAGLLEVLAFEDELGVRLHVQVVRSHNRRAVDVGANALMRLCHAVKTQLGDVVIPLRAFTQRNNFV